MCDTKSYDRFQDNEVSAFLSFVATNDHTSCIVADDEYQQEDDNEYDQLADEFHAIGKEGGSAQWPDVKSGAQLEEHLKSLKSTYDKVKEGSGNGKSKWMFYEQMKRIFGNGTSKWMFYERMKRIFGNGKSKWMFYEQMKRIFDIRARHKKLENDKLRATGRRPLHRKSAGHDETDAAGRGSPHQYVPTYSHFKPIAFGFGLILLVAAFVITSFPWSASYEQQQQQQAGTIVVNSSNIGQLVRERLTPVLASQDQVFWDILDSELTYLVSKDNPKYQPMCLTMRARRLDGRSPEASFECINKVINSLLGNSTKVLTLSGGRILDDKSDFEDSVTSHWEAGGKVTTILDFNKMSFSSALLLYKLCDDNDEPAFPGTVVLLTIEDDDSTLDDFSWMSKKLERDWKDNSAELNPLLTRIANNVVKFNPELRTDC